VTRDQAIAEEIRRMGDKAWPGHDNDHALKVRVRTLLRLRGLPAQTAHLGHAELYELSHA
jgi:hypothetical protein